MSASDGIEEIGSGTHQRIVIDLRSFNERLAKKGAINATVGLTLRPALATTRAGPAREGAGAPCDRKRGKSGATRRRE